MLQRAARAWPASRTCSRSATRLTFPSSLIRWSLLAPAGYFGEEERIKDVVDTYVLDETAFPNKAVFRDNAEFGRLKVTIAAGRDASGAFVDLVGYGGRSWAIWDADTGALVWDSGRQVEQVSYDVAHTRPFFNGQGAHANADRRSDDKGPEAEGLALGEINGRTYLFGGAERSSMIYIWCARNA